MATQTKNIWILIGVLVVAAIALAWMFSSRSTVPTSQTQATSSAQTNAQVNSQANTSTSKPSGTSAGTQTVTPPTNGTVITYTSKGFSPAYLEIKAGKAITFVNKSSGTMRVISTQVPLNQGLPNPGFDEENAVGLNGSYSLNLSIPGEWHYKSFFKPEFTGVIVVTAQ